MKVKRCPHCGWPHLTLVKEKKPRKVYIQCNHCLLRSKESLFVALAKHRWNKLRGTMTTKAEWKEANE